MPEAGATYVPRPLTDIDSDPLTEALAALIGLTSGRVVSGLGLTYASLTIHIAPGRAVVMTDAAARSAYYVIIGTQVDKTLTDNATNYVYLNATGNVVLNTTGITPADAIPLYSIVTSGGAVSGTPTTLWTSVVDFGAALKALGMNLSSGELTNLGAPLANSSAARLQDVLDAFAGVGGIKNPVRAATTANITLSGLQTIDGVVLVSQDRVLVKNQTTGSENGIYVALSGSWTRAIDFDTSAEVVPGTLIGVTEGTVSADAVYGLDTNGPITLATTALVFTRKDVQAHALLTSAHSSTSAATPSRIAERDAAGRAKFAAGAATDDALVYGQAAAGDLTGTFPSPTLAAAGPGATGPLGSATVIPIITIDTKGRVTALSSVVAAPTNAAGGDLAGTYPNPTLATQAQATIKGRAAGAGTGVPTNLSPAQAIAVLNNASEFDVQVRTSRLDQMAAPTAAVSANNQRFTNGGAPTASTDFVRLTDIGGTATALVNTRTFLNAIKSKPLAWTNQGTGVACAPLSKDVVMVIWSDAAKHLNAATYTFSTETWSSTTAILTGTNVPGSMIAQAFDASNVMVVYTDGTTAKSVVTTNGGTSWGSAVSLGTAYDAEGLDLCIISSTVAYVTAYSVTAAGKGATAAIAFFTTSNFGTSWDAGVVVESTSLSATAGYPVLAVVSASVIYVAYKTTATNIRVRKSTNSGASWATQCNITVTSGDLMSFFAAAAGKFFAFSGASAAPKVYHSYDDGTTVVVDDFGIIALVPGQISQTKNRWRDQRDGFLDIVFTPAADGIGFGFHGWTYTTGALVAQKDHLPMGVSGLNQNATGLGLTPDKNYLVAVIGGADSISLLKSRLISQRVAD